ncbi:MAG: class I SAM-dependent methyltransferase [Bacteroidota bacterium]|nr:class I SAM-dependent methyltransferase [Bacteroidota bacterium]
MSSEQKLKALAEQLRLPSGEKGIEIGNMMYQTNFSMTKHAMDFLDISTNSKILELGHGNAKHLEYLFQNQTDCCYYGLEMSELMYQQAIENTQLLSSDKFIHFQLYNGKNIPFKDRYFDAIFTVNTLYFWQNPVDFIQELYRVLKPKGRLIITFIQEESFVNLPFTKFGFQPYNNESIQKLIGKSHFTICDFQHQSENILSKMGDPIERKFSTIILQK